MKVVEIMTYNTAGDVIVGVGSVEHPEFTSGGLTVETGIYRYKLVDGAVVERTADELAADAMLVPIPTLEERAIALETATQQQAATLDEVVTILEAIV